jgi:hypothetical protein
MIRVVHPGSRILMLTFPHPGSRIQGVKKVPNPGSRIRIRNTGILEQKHARMYCTLVLKVGTVRSSFYL